MFLVLTHTGVSILSYSPASTVIVARGLWVLVLFDGFPPEKAHDEKRKSIVRPDIRDLNFCTIILLLILAVIIVFGLMNKNNELIALQSGGVSIYYLLRPVLSIGLILSIILFLLSELVVPITLSKANRIWTIEVKKKSAVISKGKNIWIKDNRAIYHIAYYNPANSTILGVSLNYFDDDFRLTRRVDAKCVYSHD